ncbi:MAG TPA: CheR family methyltransferase [Sulfurovum sp.]|nr:CheR family methyltransferase [Sulfurovum sp.]
MKDTECVSFLQQTLPTLHMQWQGFRKVRKQVCKRIKRRLQALGLSDIASYSKYLKENKEEWNVLDDMCRITISRFYRDRGVFDSIRETVLLNIAKEADAKGENSIKVWSAGAASGEEAYTLSIIWEQCFAKSFPRLTLKIVATDSSAHMIRRARRACYAFGSLKDFPKQWLEEAFEREDEHYCLKEHYKHQIRFLQQDIRQTMPENDFDLILCRNLLFSYFDEPLQRKILTQMKRKLHSNGYLVIGIHESLPKDSEGFREISEHNGIYKKLKP